MLKKIFSSMLALIMVFACIPMVAHALPEDIVLESHAADGDTSNISSDYWTEGNEVWADKSVFDNGDGSMNVLISLEARQVNGDPDGEAVGAVIDGDLTINDNLGNGFSFGDAITLNMGSSYVYSVSGGWNGSAPDGVSISVSGRNLSVSISGATLLSAGGIATISYVANCSATESGTYYVSDGCTVMVSGAIADRSEIFSKTNDAVKDGGVACSVEISGGRQVSELGNNGVVTITKVVYYSVNYSYSGEYSADVMATLPSDSAQYAAGAMVNALQPSQTTIRGTVDGREGTWSFDGWDENTKSANGDVMFVGTWSFTPDPIAYREIYRYDGVTDENVLATLPSRDELYYDGNTVVPMAPTSELVVTDAGTYVFNGWTPESVVINGANAEFVGTWLFEAKPEPAKIHVAYVYAGDVPEAVLATLPVDENEYDDASAISPAQPSVTAVAVENGTWTFKEWSRADTEALVTFTGAWTFVETPPSTEPSEPEVSAKFVVEYRYAEGMPDAVMATLPSDANEYATSDEIMPVAPIQTEVSVEGGVWSFDSWAKSVTESVVTFVGSWTFKEAQPVAPEEPEKYSVVYQYDGVTEAAVLATLPHDDATYDVVDAVTPVSPSMTTVETESGTWAFVEWGQSVDNFVVTFTGSWKFVEKQPDQPEPPVAGKYHVVYEYADVTDVIVLGTLPKDDTEYDNGTLVLAARPVADSITLESGVWYFKGWDADTKTIDGADIKFIGTWEYVPNSEEPEYPDRFSVSYTYEGIADSDSVVWATLPKDDTVYSAGTVVHPLDPNPSSVEVDNGMWTFAGWNTNEQTITHEDITFVGTWSFVSNVNPDPQPSTDGTYHVSYRYVDVEDPDVLDTLPADERTYVSGDQIIPASPSSTLVILQTGMWSFRGWDATIKVFVDNDIEFVGTWEFIPNAPEYNVIYQYVDAESLPAAVNATLPADLSTYKSGITVTAMDPSAVEVNVDGTVWKFNGWDSASKVVADANIVFTGSWSIPSVDHYAVYQYANSDALPAAVMETLPAKAGPYKAGDVVNPVQPSSSELIVGTDLWTFEGWNFTQQTIQDADVVFIGAWSTESAEDPGPGVDPSTATYGEHYMYSGSVSKEVEATLPTRFGIYANGTTVVPAMPSATEVTVQGGKWIFVGWDAQFKVIENGDVTFYGTWTFVSDVANYTEHYVYEGIDDPDVLETLPTRQGIYINGDQVFPVTPSSEIVITDAGTWSFVGWTPTVATVMNGDVTFYGKWDFVPREIPKYTEIYQYSDIEDADVLATLPTRHGEYHAGDSVIPAQPFATVVETEAGTYTFNGWDVASRVVSDADVVFTGSWTFEPKPLVVKYSEKYAYADVAEPMVIATLPTRAEMYEVGVLVMPAQPSATSIVTEDGTWTFNGWDVAGRVVTDGDVVFVGTWTFTPKHVDPEPEPTIYYGEFYKYEGENLPAEVMATLPLRTGSYGAGDVVVPAAPSADVVVLETGTWTFVGWDADAKTVVDSDITFIGTWVFEEAMTPVVRYSVAYRYDQEYPVEVMQSLPHDLNEYDDGAVVTALEPVVTSIVSTYNEQLGTWSFGGWDASEKTVAGADVIFTGTWSFTPNGSHQKYTEFYKYDQEYPAEVMATLPMSARMFENGTVVVPADPTASLVSGEVDGKVGVWKFNGWDEPQKIVSGAAVVFTGSWTFEAEASYVVNVTLKAVWLDDNNASGLRPENVHVVLRDDSELALSVNLDTAQGYQAVFEGLPAKMDGVDIQYRVIEDVPDGYVLSLATKYVPATVDTPGSIEFILTNTLDAQGIALPETGSMDAIWVVLGGMLAIGFGILVFRPKRKYE